MSFQIETTEQSYSGSDLIHQTVRAMREAFIAEKQSNKISQQKIAKKLGLNHRSIVNRWLLGKENMSLRTIGELAWALNRRAVITFERIDEVGGNYCDDRPYEVSEQDAPNVPVISNKSEVWGRAERKITNHQSAFENV